VWHRHSRRSIDVARRSTMRGVPSAAPADDSPAVVAVRQAAAALRPEIDAMAMGIGEAVRVPHVEERAGRESTHRTFVAILAAFLEWVEGGELQELSPDALALARETARAGAGLRVITRGLRVGHRNFLELWDQQLVAQGLPADVLSEAVARSRDMTFRWIDILGERLTDEYEAERERLVRSGEAQRARAVATLLAGEAADPRALSRVLRYELGRTHVGLVLWVDADHAGGDAARRMERAAQEIARSLGGRTALTLSSTATVTWAWIGASRAPELDLLPGLRTDGVSVAVGEPADGADGFRTTHQDAIDAQRVARGRARRAGAIVQYGNVELAAMLVGDLERARRFVHRHLGALAQDDEETARLRATLRVYLDEQGSRQATAERLGVHSNTVGNRVNRCQDLLGRTFGGRLLELHAALVIAQTLGPPVLTRTNSAR
jgi:DNA-binding PucR family transcriptional regulator